jgi:hypothetical protein
MADAKVPASHLHRGPFFLVAEREMAFSAAGRSTWSFDIVPETKGRRVSSDSWERSLAPTK